MKVLRQVSGVRSGETEFTPPKSALIAAGVYPAFVALIVSMYMPAPEGGGLIRPDALAMGWLIWVAQTLMIIVLGGVSLLLISRNRKPSEP